MVTYENQGVHLGAGSFSGLEVPCVKIMCSMFPVTMTTLQADEGGILRPPRKPEFPSCAKKVQFRAFRACCTMQNRIKTGQSYSFSCCSNPDNSTLLLTSYSPNGGPEIKVGVLSGKQEPTGARGSHATSI